MTYYITMLCSQNQFILLTVYNLYKKGHESHPYSEEQIDEDSKSLNMHYGDLLDVFNNNYAADASKQQTQPNLFEKKNLNSEAVALQKKNSFLKNMENSNIVNMNMSFKQNEINDNDGELIKDIKSSLDLKDNINK